METASPQAGISEIDIELRVVRPDGVARWMSSKGQALYSRSGEPLRMAGVTFGITDFKRAEEALRESEERLRLATQAAGVGVWTWDLATGQVFRTRECHLVMGVEDFGGTLDDFRRNVHPEDPEGVWAAAGRAIDHRQPCWAEFRILWPSGEVRWILNHGRADYDAAGRPLRMLGIVSDIRNPLAPIRNAVEVMRLLGPSNSQLQRMRSGTWGRSSRPPGSCRAWA